MVTSRGGDTHRKRATHHVASDQDLGEPVSGSATQPNVVKTFAPPLTAILVMKEASSSVIAPPTRQGLRSDSRDGAAT